MPAYPFTTIMSPSSQVRNEAMSRNSLSWHSVASYLNAFLNLSYKKSELPISIQIML